ncbi:CocE/NonD family hydrolase [Streptomyces sp. NPDC006990]|uniref:alpha/beta hydrolase family protein n=1 Tax=Streptomyces sp. NPDC006990 TaxID=3154481 RepID=UPI0034541E26
MGATHDGGYRPLWEANAAAGYASLSWDKPGVAGAPGDRLEQSMQDRAEEAAAAIDWARERPGIDGDRIGLRGASQAGWVLAEVAAETRVSFAITVSPATNWLRQAATTLRTDGRALPGGGPPAGQGVRRAGRPPSSCSPRSSPLAGRSRKGSWPTSSGSWRLPARCGPSSPHGSRRPGRAVAARPLPTRRIPPSPRLNRSV